MGNPDHRVLVVDDDPTMLELLSHGLSRDKNLYEVICTSSAKEAIDIIERIHISLVVSDVRMPVMSGLDLMAKIRKRWPHIKVILITGHSSQKLRKDIKKSGCLNFFEKPIKTKQLREFIKRELSGGNDEGFAGTLNNIQLPDLIQMCCSSGISTVIRVQKDARKGIIYIEDGDIIHAECEKIEGSEAFYKIFSWRSGSFETLGNIACPKITIKKNWQYLLMEGHRRIDEADDINTRTDETESTCIDFELLSDDEIADALMLDPEDEKTDIFDNSIQAGNKDKAGEFTPGKKRILIVDDSPMMCRILTDMLSEDEEIEVAGTAQNGEEALKQIDKLNPDLITLDVNMPVMDGSTALKHIMIKKPCPVVILSAVKNKNSSRILDFLLLGAVDFIQKPVNSKDAPIQKKQLAEAVKNATLAKIKRFKRFHSPRVIKKKDRPVINHKSTENLVVILSGTGGYTELIKILPAMPPDLNSSFLVFQKIADSFLVPFASYLKQRCKMEVALINQRAPLLTGVAYMESAAKPALLVKGEKGHFIKTMANIPDPEKPTMPEVFFKSALENLSGKLFVVLLSGADIGNLDVLSRIKEKNGKILAQNRDQCMVSKPIELAKERGLISFQGFLPELVEYISISL